jgi:hypothetical protein
LYKSSAADTARKSCWARTTRASSGRLITRGTTMAASMPRITTTTITSMSVKPLCAWVRLRAYCMVTKGRFL